MCKSCVIGPFGDGLNQFSQTVSRYPRMHPKTSEMVRKYFQNDKILPKRFQNGAQFCSIFSIF